MLWNGTRYPKGNEINSSLPTRKKKGLGLIIKYMLIKRFKKLACFWWIILRDFPCYFLRSSELTCHEVKRWCCLLHSAHQHYYSFKGGPSPTSSISMRWHQGLMDAWVTLNALKKRMLPIALQLNWIFKNPQVVALKTFFNTTNRYLYYLLSKLKK